MVRGDFLWKPALRAGFLCFQDLLEPSVIENVSAPLGKPEVEEGTEGNDSIQGPHRASNPSKTYLVGRL